MADEKNSKISVNGDIRSGLGCAIIMLGFGLMYCLIQWADHGFPGLK